jgi:hypothetical protein
MKKHARIDDAKARVQSQGIARTVRVQSQGIARMRASHEHMLTLMCASKDAIQALQGGAA